MNAARACSRCVLDSTDDPDLTLNAEGICNYCLGYEQQFAELCVSGPDADRKLRETVEEIRRAGKGKKYDSILGLSGGTDSSYVAHLAHDLGLRPLAVHCDNGWNSELAVQNIERVVKTLNVDLFTYVINWEEFRDVQLAYLKASVIDIEVVSDHAIAGVLLRLAKKHGIRHILSGSNVATEAVLPRRWVFDKADQVNLRAIHRRYGTVRLRNYPVLDWRLKVYCHYWLGLRAVTLLNMVPYTKAKAHELLTSKFGWRDYGVKHGESTFTRFYQCYILPRKFGVDKRRAHLSNLICSGQITRAQALEELGRPPYDPETLRVEMAFVLKKLGLSTEAFEAMMSEPVKSHLEYPIERPLRLRPALAPVRRVWRFARQLNRS